MTSLLPSVAYPAPWQHTGTYTSANNTYRRYEDESENIVAEYHYATRNDVTSLIAIYWYERSADAHAGLEKMRQYDGNHFSQHVPLHVGTTTVSSYISARATQTSITCLDGSICITYGQYGPYVLRFTARTADFMTATQYIQIVQAIDQQMSAKIPPSMGQIGMVAGHTGESY